MSQSNKLFETIKIGNLTLQNRIVRSATFEGMCDGQGFPANKYCNVYESLSKNEIGAIITGFAYVSSCGRAMQPGQAGIDDDAKIPAYKRITDAIHARNGKIFMQIAHSGRQTIAKAVGGVVRGVSAKKSFYFGGIPRALTTQEAMLLAQFFADAALRAKKAGFDGVQLHAAHGYLIHQFILPSINDRRDEFGIDREYGIGIHFLKLVIDKIRALCGNDYPLLVKVSSGDDYRHSFNRDNFIQLIHFLDVMKVGAIEISYGTMDYAFNIFRGQSMPFDSILKHNPRYKANNNFNRFLMKHVIYPFMKPTLKMFISTYNLSAARIAKKYTHIPIMCVGGFRSKQEMAAAVENNDTDLVSLCRPFICEPDLVFRLKNNDSYVSRCLNCNICAVMCDSGNSTKCYFGHDPM